MNVAKNRNQLLPVNPQLLGARRYCKWIYMGNNHWEWVCRTDQGGGNKASGGGMPLLGRFGAAATATPAIQTNSNTDTPTTLTTSEINENTAGGFDIMQFVSDNALWLGLGVVGVVAIMIFSKKRR